VRAWNGPSGMNHESASEAMWDLRASSLRYVLAFTFAGHLAWHTLFTAISPFDAGLKAWMIFPVVVGGEAVAYRLLGRNPAASAIFFVPWALACCTSATWLFQSSAILYIYPLIALVATITIHPLAGLLTAAGEAILLEATLIVFPSSFFGEAQLATALLASTLTALVAWTLVRNLMEAVNRSLDHYEQARRNMRDAQDHRAKLVQALKQLDIAYYHLQGANAALAVAWRAAESAERAKAELVANISHELRTPLNLIVGFSEMMMSAPESYGSQPLPREYRADLNAIYRSAQHLLDLTDDVLDLAQAEVNRLALIRDRANLAEIVREAVGIVSDYIHAKGLRLNVAIEPDLPSMSLDRLRIRQVILNLLTNAARFTERGSISIAISCQGDDVLVAVTDTGPGIPTDRLARMFEEFHHVDELAAREHVSTGLGLSISKKFVELHHGRMWVESELGVGTSFRVTLPVEDFGEDPRHEPSAADRPWTLLVPPAPVQPPLVLADQSPSLHRLLQRRLDSYRVVSTTDSEQAMRLAEELKAVAIIADPATPVAAAATPVIRCNLASEHVAAKTLGVADYLVKPVTHVDLRAAIDRLGVPITRVLLADDDLHAVRLLTRMLSLGGDDYELLSAYNGDEALATIRATRPDLVILDLAMPERSGQEVLRAVQADPELSALPIIVVSASAPDETGLPTSTELTITKSDGMTSPEILDVIEGVLRVLALPRSYLPATDAGLESDRSVITA
jgi:signal transduction histidine kinase/CheY-like chemotaxis protein